MGVALSAESEGEVKELVYIREVRCVENDELDHFGRAQPVIVSTSIRGRVDIEPTVEYLCQ